MYFRLLAIFAILAVPAALSADQAKAKKVLYVTHEPGRWHAYSPQLRALKEIAAEAKWDLKVITGDHDGQIGMLRTPEYAKGYDAIIYNFCFAKSTDTDAAANLMMQTRELGVPAMLIHCAMHSWWPTYKTGKPGALGESYKGKALADAKVVKAWRAKHGDKPFPVWGDFTGIASHRHGPKTPITVNKLVDHPATKSLETGWVTPGTELYNNAYQVDGVKPLLEGVQGKAKAIVMWTCPQGKSQVLGLSLGHGPEWDLKEFRNLVIDGVEYLIANPTP
jgi:hypothetical protein